MLIIISKGSVPELLNYSILISNRSNSVYKEEKIIIGYDDYYSIIKKN